MQGGYCSLLIAVGIVILVTGCSESYSTKHTVAEYEQAMQASQRAMPASPYALRSTAARRGAYVAALQSKISQNWIRPGYGYVTQPMDCPIRILQIPGGQVISAKVLPDCPFNEEEKEAVEAAVLRAEPLPYSGFEDVFERDIILHFKVEK